MQFFSTFDIARLFEIGRTRIQDWMNHGFIRPSQSSPGQGSKALFSVEDLYAIRLFMDLSAYGLKRNVAAKITDWLLGHPHRLQRDPPNWGRDLVYITTGSQKDIGDLKPDQYLGIFYGPPGVQPTLPNEEAEDPVFISMVIRLKSVKTKVDRLLL